MSNQVLPSVSPLDDMAANFKQINQRLASLERASSGGGGGGGGDCCPVISDTEPVAPDPGVIWVDPTADCGSGSDNLGVWETATYENGWIAYPTGTEWGGVEYLLDGYRVWIRGEARHEGTPAATSTIFTLPVGYRPGIRQSFIARASGLTLAGIDISTTGEVGWRDMGGDPTFVAIDTSFYVGEQP